MSMVDVCNENSELAAKGERRDGTLDYARGIAIFLIVIYHIYGYTGRYMCVALATIVFTIAVSEILGKNKWTALFLFGVKKKTAAKYRDYNK